MSHDFSDMIHEMLAGSRLHTGEELVTMAVDEKKVTHLSESDVWDIQAHLDRAMDTNAGSGDHWILMACLNRHGFQTGGTDEAMRVAEEILVTWYRKQQD